MIHKFEALFDDQVRPILAQHGGNAEIIDFDNHKLFIKMTGGCQGCSASKMTLKQGIETIVKEKFPIVEEVIDLTDHDSGDNPYFSDSSR